MSEYIKKQDVLNLIESAFGWSFPLGTVYEKIQSMPAADVQQVVYGENLTKQHPSDEFICSNCGFTAEDFCGYNIEDDVYYEFQIKFCPCCGRIIKE